MSRAPLVILAVGVSAMAACSSLVGADFGDVVPGLPGFDGGDFPDGGPPPDVFVPQGDGGPCGPLDKSCGGTCVAIDDPLYGCGGATCTPCELPSASATCSGGACVIAACDQGFGDCDGDAANGCEVDLTSNPAHCGSCPNACGSTQVCDLSQCSASCTGGLVPCSGACVNTATNPQDCDGCGISCTVPADGYATCASSTCGIACYAPYIACGSACVTESASACGPSCLECNGPPSGEGTGVCTNHACTFACDGGYNACNGDCVPNSPSACGASCTVCENPVDSTATCDPFGNCGYTCDPGYVICGAGCCQSTEDAGSSLEWGNTTQFTATTSFTADILLGIQISITQAGTVTALGVLPDGTGVNVQLALYSDSDNVPSQLVASTASTPLTGTSLVIPVTSPTAISAGNYWVMGVYDVAPTAWMSTTATTTYYVSQTFGAALPTTLSSPTEYASSGSFNYFAVTQ